jgi:hypothetical protein
MVSSFLLVKVDRTTPPWKLDAIERQREYYDLLSEGGPGDIPSHACHAINAVKNFLFPMKTYDEMMESDRLPLHTQHGRIIYELERGLKPKHCLTQPKTFA